MKYFFTFITLYLLTNLLLAQAPEGFNYQAVVRNTQNELVTNQAVTFKISIVDQDNDYYSEVHNTTTNENGLVSLVIGQGEIISGEFKNAFETIGQKSIKVEIDIEGGSNFSLLGTNFLWSVPYAVRAKKADFADSVSVNQLVWSRSESNAFYNVGNVGIGTNSPNHHLEINADATGDEGINRQFISVRNFNNTFKSYAAVGLSSGTDLNKSDGALAVTAMNYTAIPDLSGMTYVVNNENGVAIRARGASGKLKFWTGGDGTSFERMTISSNGNIGVSNTNPQYQFDVNGAINASEFLLNGSPINITTPWSSDSNNIHYNDGFVGIGTENPERSLEINIDADGTNAPRGAILIKNLDNSGKSSIGTIFYSGTGSNEAGGALGITAMSYDAVPDFAGYTYLQNENNGVALKARNPNGKLRFYTGGDNPEHERMTIRSNGNVGIGTSSPEHHLEINADATGDDGINRQFISVRNLNNTFKSYSAVGLSSGTDANKSDGALAVTAMNYTAIPDLSGMTYVVNNENGVAIRARGASGKLKFWTGGDGSSFERMTISSAGNIGVSNTDPQSKLQVSNGDVYIDNVGSGVIMKSPDGNCWRMTVDNSGNPVFTSITCP